MENNNFNNDDVLSGSIISDFNGYLDFIEKEHYEEKKRKLNRKRRNFRSCVIEKVYTYF